jgi:hypothetical protein
MQGSTIGLGAAPIAQLRKFLKAWVKPNQATYGGLSQVGAAHLLDRIAADSGHSKQILLISGFWRSGTTWLQEYLAKALQAKTVFEPLSPSIAFRNEMLIQQGIAQYDVRQALVPGPQTNNDSFWRYLDNVMTGREGDDFSLSCRSTLSESSLRRIVTKDVRLQFNLHEFHNRYSVPIIHIRRHPCAVINSLSSCRWDWSFDNISIVDLFDGLEQVLLNPIGLSRDCVRDFDTDADSRIAAYWAITERSVECSALNQPWFSLISYEDMLTQPESVLRMVNTRFGLRVDTTPDPSVNSVTTGAAFGPGGGGGRADAWNRAIGPERADRILHVVRELFPGYSAETH